jgi:c-di-GMP-binding flagellar brake protein YcgR
VLEKIKERSIKVAFVERRRYPRIEKKLPLNLRGAEFEIITETKNISCIGSWCQIPRYLPVFTKLGISIFLPFENKTERIDCKGVIVRTEEGSNNVYNVGIYFNEIKKSDQEKISQYIDYYLKR